MTLEGELPDENIEWENCIVDVDDVTYSGVLSNNVVNVDLQPTKNP